MSPHCLNGYLSLQYMINTNDTHIHLQTITWENVYNAYLSASITAVHYLCGSCLSTKCWNNTEWTSKSPLHIDHKSCPSITADKPHSSTICTCHSLGEWTLFLNWHLGICKGPNGFYVKKGSISPEVVFPKRRGTRVHPGDYCLDQNNKRGEVVKGSEGSDVFSNTMILRPMKAWIECCYKHIHTGSSHTQTLTPHSQKHISCHTHLACSQTRRDGD